jgi:putative ATPase
VIERARERRGANGRHTVLFLDEIHRFNKAQQDALLPAVEEGLLTLIGATTENPYFEVNSALLSRCQIYELRPLSPKQVVELLRRALSDPERGLAEPPPVEDPALAMLAQRSGGDARVALSALERAVERSHGELVDVAAIEDALQRKALDYDRQGDRHYDFVSAWIKATRGSDVDASLYYLAVMLEGGEDPRFIARRMVILASEDVGNATSLRPLSTSPLPQSPTPPTKPLDAPAPRCARTAPKRRPTTCATLTIPAPGSSAGGRATAMPMTSPVRSATSR